MKNGKEQRRANKVKKALEFVKIAEQRRQAATVVLFAAWLENGGKLVISPEAHERATFICQSKGLPVPVIAGGAGGAPFVIDFPHSCLENWTRWNSIDQHPQFSGFYPVIEPTGQESTRLFEPRDGGMWYAITETGLVADNNFRLWTMNRYPNPPLTLPDSNSSIASMNPPAPSEGGTQ